jgi:hypothetical protein
LLHAAAAKIKVAKAMVRIGVSKNGRLSRTAP